MKIIKYLNSIKFKYNNPKICVIYFLFAFIRILLVFIPQFGYIHPDEFFQSVEVMAGDNFDLEHERTWEFNPKFPVRSITISYFLINIPLSVLRFLSIYIKYHFQIDLRQTYVLLIYPRLIICLLSFINDWSLYKICKLYSIYYDVRLTALSSSFIMLIFGSRTFSNTIEMCLCSILLWIVSKCMLNTNTILFQRELLQYKYQRANGISAKVRFYKLINGLPRHSLNDCFILANLCIFGIFNRPTFIVFGMPIIFFWFLRGMGTKLVTFFDFNIRIIVFFLSTIPLTILLITIDSIYYGYLTSYDIINLKFNLNNFVVTPLNFIRYNIDPANTGKHGVHPKYLHLLINIPLLYNILGIITIGSFILMVVRFCSGNYKNLPRAQSIVTLMTASIVIPLILFSLINHQEPRFLIPLTLPIILLHAIKLKTGIFVNNPFPWKNGFTDIIYNRFLCTKVSRKWITGCWFTINLILTIFFGFIHQGGVYQLINHFTTSLQIRNTNINHHLVTTHLYNLPKSLFYLPNSNTIMKNPETGQKYRRSLRLFIYEYGSLEMDLLIKKLKLLIYTNEFRKRQTEQKYLIYLAIPFSLNEQFLNSINVTNSKYTQIAKFYPHLSTEAMPKFSIFLTNIINESHYLSKINENKSYFQFIYKLTQFIFNEFILFIQQFNLILYRIEEIQ